MKVAVLAQDASVHILLGSATIHIPLGLHCETIALVATRVDTLLLVATARSVDSSNALHKFYRFQRGRVALEVFRRVA